MIDFHIPLWRKTCYSHQTTTYYES